MPGKRGTVLVTAAVLMAVGVAPTALAGQTIVQADRILDIESGRIVRDAVVVIADGRIQSVLEDIRTLEDVQFVMKGGRVYKRPQGGLTALRSVALRCVIR